MNLFQYLNSQEGADRIAKQSSEIMDTKEFWDKDQIRYNETIAEINKDHSRIQMSAVKANIIFDI